MSNVLILGASGFLGRAIVKKFHKEGVRVGALSRNPLHSENKLIKQHSVDILNEREIEVVVSEYDIIVNCTGQISNPIHQCLVQNTDGIRNIVAAVKKYNKKLIHFSSVSVYGSSEYVNEESKLNPETVYGGIKYFSEYIINQELNDSLILRVSNLYGQNQDKGIMSYLTKQYLLNKKRIFFNNNGEMFRYYLDVNDLASIVYRLTKIKRIFGTFNVIGPCRLTIKELILKFEYILNSQFSVEYQNMKPVENISRIDNNKINSILSYDFKSSVDKHIGNQKND